MTTLLLVRHGYAKSNELRIFLGQQNMPLTELGAQQAELVATHLSSIKIDAVYSSDLTRAMQTAEPTAQAQSLKIIPHKGLREIYAGKCEFMPWEEIRETYPTEYELWRNEPLNSGCPGGETCKELQDRMYSTILEIAKANDDKTVAIFSHGGALRSFFEKLEHIKTGVPVRTTMLGNASITTVIYNNGEFTVKEYGYDKHLGDLVTKLPPII